MSPERRSSAPYQRSQVRKHSSYPEYSSINAAIAISRDVAGNLYAGQDARIVGHLRNLLAVLEGLEAKLEAGNDFRAEKTLEAVLQTSLDNLDDMPAFDPELMGPAQEKWAALGVDFSDMLLLATDVLDPAKAITPEMKAVFEKFQKQMQETTS